MKFTPKGGSVTLGASYSEIERAVLVSVSDTGIGVQSDSLRKLFKPFSQVESSLNRSQEGTGLGLAISKRIILAHSGKIWVESKVGKGTTFYFTLPVVR
jgi:signal transduction histidine kinase